MYRFVDYDKRIKNKKKNHEKHHMKVNFFVPLIHTYTHKINK